MECFNCHKKGHKKAECWAKGGRKEGQGPKSKLKKEKDESKKGKDEPKKELANTAEEDGVWMAMTSNSDDKNMANSELNDFTVSENELFFFEDNSDEDKEGNILDLTTQLKWLLKISDPSKYTTYPYDDPDYFCDVHNFADSSDDEQGAVAMTVESESNNEELNPY